MNLSGNWALPDMQYNRNGILNRFAPANASVVEGNIQIKAEAKDGVYWSALITTLAKWSFLYGYMEIRARVPTGQGFWSSFFAVGEKWPPEIDVFENIGKDAFYLSTWTGDPAQLEQKVVPLPNMSKDYHTYAVDWQKDKLIWIFDGKEVFRTVESIPQTPLCLYLMFAVGGWPGAPDATTVLPAYYDIDYVRVWQRK